MHMQIGMCTDSIAASLKDLLLISVLLSDRKLGKAPKEKSLKSRTYKTSARNLWSNSVTNFGHFIRKSKFARNWLTELGHHTTSKISQNLKFRRFTIMAMLSWPITMKPADMTTKQIWTLWKSNRLIKWDKMIFNKKIIC